MDSRGGVLPEGMPEVGGAGPEFFTNAFVYGDNGPLKYSMPSAYSNNFAYATQVDATAIPFTHQPQQSHQLQFSNQTYSPQTAIRSPLPQHAQPTFGDPYTTQLRQLVQQSPSTISPAQLQPQPQPQQQTYTQPPLPWDEISHYPSTNDHQLQAAPRQQAAAPSSHNFPNTAIHSSSSAVHPISNWSLLDGSSLSPSHGLSVQSATYLTGCYWATIEPESSVPEQWAGELYCRINIYCFTCC